MKAGQQFLTRRQIEIVSLVAQGLSNAEVADHLCIDERTVRNQMHRILGDLNLKRRSQLAIFAHQAHLVSLTEVELPRAAQRALEQIRPQRSALEEVSMNAAKSTIHCHQVVIDGKVFYEGEDWASVFLAASENPEYGEIVYVEDGVPGARFGAPLHREALQCKSQS